MTVRRFASRKDPWIILVLGGTAFLETVAAGLLAITPGLPAGLRIVLPLLLAASAALIVWCLLRTTYRVGGGMLEVRSGPFRWTVPLEAIESVAPLRSPLAAPALSLHRVEIRCAGGRPSLQISPDDRTAFLDALVEANPRIALAGAP